MLSINKYLQHLEYEGKAFNTIETYRYHLIAFGAWLDEQKMPLRDLKPTHLLEFKEYLLQLRKSGRTVNRILSCVRNYFDYMILNEEVQFNPVSKLMKINVAPSSQRRLISPSSLRAPPSLNHVLLARDDGGVCSAAVFSVCGLNFEYSIIE